MEMEKYTSDKILMQKKSLIIKIMKLVSLILMEKGYREVGRGHAVLTVLPPGSAEETDHQLVETLVNQRASA